jgi:hypothetical protein
MKLEWYLTFCVFRKKKKKKKFLFLNFNSFQYFITYNLKMEDNNGIVNGFINLKENDNSVKEKLEDAQRKFRNLEQDRKAYAEETVAVIKK